MSVDAECPFFKSGKDGGIRCECADMRMPDKKARREILYGYCAHPTNFRRCMLYIALENYYERIFSNGGKED